MMQPTEKHFWAGWGLGAYAAVISFIIALGVSACVGPAPAPVASSCGTPAMAIIHPSSQDTDDTLRQILLHNESARAQCPDAG